MYAYMHANHELSHFRLALFYPFKIVEPKIFHSSFKKIERNTESLQNAQNVKIENVACSV
jgi:hypothetical protein